MSSYTVSLTGVNSILKSTLFPALRLREDKEWEVALLDLTTYNSIPNVLKGVNNKLHYYRENNKKGENNHYSGLEIIRLPEGSYEIDDINDAIYKQLGQKNVITITGNNNTLKTEIKSKYYIDFSREHSIGEILGFPKTTQILQPDEIHVSEKTVNIIPVNTINVMCNIIQGSYKNGENSHILHTFSLSVPPGFRIIERPHNLVYLPCNTSYISDVVVSILDQNGKLVNFRGETIDIRLHIRAVA